MTDPKIVFSWLNEIDTSPEEVSDEATEWLIKTDQRGLPLFIFQLIGEDRVIIRRQFELPPDQINSQENLSVDARANFIFELKHDLLLGDARYSMIFDEEAGDILTSISIENYIYEDGFSKDRFFERYFGVVSASGLFIMLLKKHKLFKK